MTRNVALTVLGTAILLATVEAGAADRNAPIDRYRATHEALIVGRLDQLARMKSVAADPAGLKAAADYLQNQLQQRGFDARELVAGTGAGAPPAVFGSLKTAGAKRTVIFYAHYDGQPVTPAQWSSDPFVPVMRSGALNSGEHEVDWQNAHAAFDPEWRLFARAVSDDKASIVAFLSAFDALKATHIKPSVNIKVLWEGEEEAGSPHLAAILRDNRALLGADLILIGDGPVHQSRRPMLYFGARGIMSLEATVYGPIRALHDGHYGNWVPNPAAMAANLIAQMRDDEGRILIPGFADGVRAAHPGRAAGAAQSAAHGRCLEARVRHRPHRRQRRTRHESDASRAQHPRHERRPSRRFRRQRHSAHRHHRLRFSPGAGSIAARGARRGRALPASARLDPARRLSPMPPRA